MKEIFNWLRVVRSENITNNVFWKLLQRYHTIENVLDNLPALIKAAGKNNNFKLASKEMIEEELIEANKYGVQYICANQSTYPPILKHIPYPPPILSIVGDINILQKPAISVVGSRKATNTGMQLANAFAKQLGLSGFTIVSGLAIGIDTAAHKASIESGTIAVLAGGVNYIYPTQNRRLYYEIIDNGGAIISEKPFNYTPNATDFPKRNKIIAGLSLGMLVVEASKRSGSLISARLANEYNKIVFSIPHSLLNEKGQGNNELLRDGATIALAPNDIIETLLPLTFLSKEKSKPSLMSEAPVQNYLIKEPDYSTLLQPPIYNKTTDLKLNNINITDDTRKTVLKNLNFTPTSIETIQKFSNIPLEEVEQAILELQLAGKIKLYANNNIALKY